MLSSFLKEVATISRIKKQEIILPIARAQALVSSLRVGDDLGLRTSITSPVNYDRDMSKLLYELTDIVYAEGEVPKKENFEKFCGTISNIDKICLIWGLYKSSYDTLGERTLKCEKENCKTVFKQEITLESLIQEDTFTIWDEDKPFYNFIYDIQVPYLDYIYLFETRIPSIRDNNRLLSNISVNALQNNLNQTGSLFTRREQLTLLSKSVAVVPKGNSTSANDIPRTENMQEMLLAFTEYVPSIVSEGFFEEYNKKFDKYYPKFYTNVPCSNCGNLIKFEIDLEIEFFRRSLYGRGESS